MRRVLTKQALFKWRHFEAELILLCVRWYLRYSLSYRDLEAHPAGTRSARRSYDDLSVGPTLRARTGEALSALPQDDNGFLARG
jgi:hypothetical protein